MLKENYTQKLFSSAKTLILHEKDWESRLGTFTFKNMIDAGALVRPSLDDVKGQEFPYFIDGTFIDSEIIVEGDSVFLSPIIDGYEVISIRPHEIELWKFTKETAVTYIRKINNLSLVQLETVNSHKVLVVGQLNLPGLSSLILWALDADVSVGYLESMIPNEVQGKFHKIIVLCRHDITLGNKFVAAPYRDFMKIPLSVFRMGLDVKCEQLCLHFKYPLVIDTENKFVFIFGKKLGVKRETNLYKFVHAMATTPSLPMETGTFFRMNKVTKEAHETAIKELRSQLKEKIEEAGLDKIEIAGALVFFDLVSGEKSRGEVDLKLGSEHIHIW